MTLDNWRIKQLLEMEVTHPYHCDKDGNYIERYGTQANITLDGVAIATVYHGAMFAGVEKMQEMSDYYAHLLLDSAQAYARSLQTEKEKK